MLEPLIIEGSKTNPTINLNKDANFFKIAGRSIVEDPNKFYMPVYEWLEEYVKNPNEDTKFQFDLEYFNSSSARQVMKLIMLLENIPHDKVTVVWLFEEGDEMAQERGEEIKQVSKLNFEITEYPLEDDDFEV